MKKFYLIITLLLCLIFVAALPGQNYTRISAFEKSMEREKNKDYTGALKAITELHDSITYDVVLRLAWLNFKVGFKK